MGEDRGLAASAAITALDSLAPCPAGLSSRVTFESRNGCLMVHVGTMALPGRSDALFRKLALEAARAGAGRILIDFRDMIGQLAAFEEAQAGHAAAAHLGGMKCAFLIQRNRQTGVAPSHAASGGLLCKSFSDEDEALAWLEAR
ncbi:hypothetical protein [Caenimonas aquaedulcis]|uniref:STAS/SEC14 domain-containing protein n=1 Tax=Caenimonas aquaedulcis TaxID=2793270 RepID=A0A931H7S2_9BURK|nr:hypothetical protein [Caenimonas aquaedulcis]MBG9390176.1 hypothetical protein [Caenimonas aquaedulcis]